MTIMSNHIVHDKLVQIFRNIEKGKWCNYLLQNIGIESCVCKWVSECSFNVGMYLPAGLYMSDDDVKYIVETIKKYFL